MAITSEQARVELQHRGVGITANQARAELAKRGVTIPDKPMFTGSGVTSTGVRSTPVPLQEMAELQQAEWLHNQIVTGNIVPVEPSFWQKYKAELPRAIGATVGGIVGAATFGPDPTDLVTVPAVASGVSKFIGGVLFAGVGGAGGTGYQQLYRMNQPGAAAKSLSELYKEQAIAFAKSSAEETFGFGVAKVGGKILAPLKSKLIPGVTRLGKKLGEAAKRMGVSDLSPYAQKLLKKKGVFLTSAQKTESRGMDFVESATEGSIFGGNRLHQLKRVLMPKAFKQFTKETSDKFWQEAGERLTPAETGNLFVDTVLKGKQALSRIHRMMYSQVDDITGDITKTIKITKEVPGSILTETGKPFTKTITTEAKRAVDLRPVKKAALEIIEKAKKSKALGSSGPIRKLAQKVKSWDDFAETFMDAHAMRSDILEEVRKLEGRFNIKLPKVHRAAEKLAGLTDDAMEVAAKNHSKNAHIAWRAANKSYKEGADKYGDELVKGALALARKSPEKVANSVFKPHGTQTLSRLKNVMDDKTYKTLLASWIDGTIEKSSSADGIVLGKTFKNKITKMGSEMLNKMFDSPEHLRDVLDIGELGAILQAPTGGGGGMIVQLTQAGAVVEIGTGLFTGQPGIRKGSGAILFGPAILGRMLSNPTATKWLSEGLLLPANTPQGAALAARLIGLATGAAKQKPKDESQDKIMFQGTSRTGLRTGMGGV